MNRRNSPQSRPSKVVDQSLLVHVWTPEGFMVAGTLVLDEEGQRIGGSFRYNEAYLQAAGAYALDPLNMPLGRTIFSCASPHVTLGAIFDAAPDAWGRRVVAAQISDEVRQRIFRSAFLRGADGIGALVITPKALDGKMELQAHVQQSLNERPALSDIEAAAYAAARLEEGMALTPQMQEMLAGSWTIGGARPKAILRDDRPGAVEGASLIAKFPSANEPLERNRLEHACLAMASEIGFAVPKHELVEIRGGAGSSTASGCALVLERFDRPLLNGRIHRLHYISAMSLASYEPQSRYLDSPMDLSVLSWSKMMDMATQVASKPTNARVQMYGRLCLNAALQNSDDHLKNFGFLRSDASPVHYNSAPVFDVSAQGARRHYLHLCSKGQVYTLEDAIDCSRELGISAIMAKQMEEAIVATLRRRLEFFDKSGMSESDAKKADAWIAQGLGPKYSGGSGSAAAPMNNPVRNPLKKKPQI